MSVSSPTVDIRSLDAITHARAGNSELSLERKRRNRRCFVIVSPGRSDTFFRRSRAASPNAARFFGGSVFKGTQ